MSFDTPNPESLSMTIPGGDCLSIGEDEGAGEKEDKDAEDAEDFQPQNMRDVGFSNTCESLIHPSIIVQACIHSEQNSSALIEEDFQRFLQQPLEAQQRNLSMYFQSLADLGPDFGVTKRLS